MILEVGGGGISLDAFQICSGSHISKVTLLHAVWPVYGITDITVCMKFEVLLSFTPTHSSKRGSY